jgi:hypothetical protein
VNDEQGTMPNNLEIHLRASVTVFFVVMLFFSPLVLAKETGSNWWLVLYFMIVPLMTFCLIPWKG